MSYIGNTTSAASYAIDTFSGDGSTVNFTLRDAPVSTSAILVFVGGVRQELNTYSLSSTTLTFTGAPPSGTLNIQVVFSGAGTSVAVPSDGSVTTAKMASNITLTGNTTTSNLIVTGNTTTSNLTVTGNTTTGNLTATGNVTVSTSVAVTRNVSTSNIIVSNLTTTSNLLVTGNTTTGNLTVTGNVTFTNAVGLSTNGTNAVYIDSSQNVGIGTASPTNKLHVASSSFETIKLQGTSTVSGINFVNSASGNGYIYYDNGPNMLFYTNGSERARINSSGNLQTIGTISVGNATPSTSGAGITFPATVSLSTDANTLDDYEEGTWTPSLGGNTTYTARTGTYTKIGNTVRVYLEVTVNLIGTGSTTTVSGFPFSPFGNDAGCVSYFDTLNASVYWLTIQMQSGGNCIFAGTTAATATIVNGVSIFRNGARIIGTAVYQTSS